MCEFQRLGRGQLWEPSFSLSAFICQVSPQSLSPCRGDTPGTSLISPYWGSWQSWTEQRVPQSRHFPPDHLTNAGCPKPPQEGALGSTYTWAHLSRGRVGPSTQHTLGPSAPVLLGPVGNATVAFIQQDLLLSTHSFIHSTPLIQTEPLCRARVPIRPSLPPPTPLPG